MFTLSEIEVQFYEKNGFLVIENFFDGNVIKSALDAIDGVLVNQPEAYEREPMDKSVARRIWAPTEKHEIFKSIAIDPNMLNAIEQLIGSNFQFHYSKLNIKGPKIGSKVMWHQDYAYYPHTNSDLLTALIFFDDANKENGCLKVVPGSHLTGLKSHYIDGFFRGVISDVDENKSINIEVGAGSVLFLHSLTMHASDVNTSNSYRRTFLPAYRASDAFPIYFGPHAAHNEKLAFQVRGLPSKIARVVAQDCILPIPEKPFSSLYEIQEGSHLGLNKASSNTGY